MWILGLLNTSLQKRNATSTLDLTASFLTRGNLNFVSPEKCIGNLKMLVSQEVNLLIE